MSIKMGWIVCLIMFVVSVSLVVCSILDQVLPERLFEFGGLHVRATAEQSRRIMNFFMVWPDISSPWPYAVGTIMAVLMYYAYRLFFIPINRIRLLGDGGYIPEHRMTMKDAINAARKRRQIGDVPPVYPNGWLAVMESQYLKKGEVKSVGCLGKNLAVFRGDDDRSHVVDAYCPHMGANLAVGGIVKGSCLECPFHGWQFRGDDGKCTHIPYCERKHIPEVAKVKAYCTNERNGFIYIWHHAEGIDPTWEPPEIEEISNGELKYQGRTEHIVNSHVQDIAENVADSAHFSQVHGPFLTAGADLRFIHSTIWNFVKHEWNCQWHEETDPDQRHIGVLDVVHGVKVGGWNFPLLDVKATVRQIGPGIVNMSFETFFGKGAYLLATTSLEPLRQRMVHHIYFQKHTPAFVGRLFLMFEAYMLERDIMIWNNKTYVSKPLFVKSKEDALIARHRRWYSQFYSEHSPRIKIQTESVEW